MNFDTPFFICCFLPLLLFLYRAVPGETGKNCLLLAAGLLFYAFDGLTGLGLLLLAALGNYLLGLLLMKWKGRRAVLLLGVGGNLLFLGAFKYLNFLLTGILGLREAALPVTAPLGISFFTFKAISYLVDLYRQREGGTRRFFDFLLYLSFFPQVTAGPITRFGDFFAQLSGRGRGETALGLRRFVVGLAKKVLLSVPLAKLAGEVFALTGEALDARLAWLGAVAYLLQIYFDFSGYSDMAIGLGEMFGFRTPENFRYPYAALTITDFWRRWHISLSSWFRDYLYIPLGGNRKGKWRTALNKFLVFAFCGLWHGAAWTFVVWGAWHGLLSALESLVRPDPRGRGKRALWRLYTLVAVCLGFVMFRAGSVGQGFGMIAAMFTGWHFTAAGTAALHGLLNAQSVSVLFVGAAACLPIGSAVRRREALWNQAEPASYAVCLGLFLLCLLKLAAGGFVPFIYAQF